MSQSAEQLLVRIDATTEQLRRELHRGDQTVAQSTRRMDTHLRRVDRSFDRLNRSVRIATRVLGAFGLSLGATQLIRFGREAITASAGIQDVADTAGITTDAVQELRGAFRDLGGVTASVTDGALQRFNRRLGLARQGTGAAASTFQRLGIDLRQDTNAALEQTIRILADIANQADRAAAAARLFGDDAGPQLAAALRGGNTELQAVIRNLHETNRIMSNESVDAAVELRRSWDSLWDSWKNRGAQATLEMIRVLQGLGQVIVPDTEGELDRWREALDSGIHPFTGEPLTDAQMERIAAQVRELERRLGVIAQLQGTVLKSGTVGLRDFAAAADAIMEEIIRAHRDAMFPDTEMGQGGTISRWTASHVDLPGQRHNEMLRERERILGQIQTPEERYAATIKTLNELRDTEIRGTDQAMLSQEQYQRAVKAAADELDRSIGATEEFNRLGADMGFTFSSAFEDAIVGGEKFREVLRGLSQDLQRLFLRELVTEPLAKGITGAMPNFFGGGRAAGGPVRPGRLYEVNERGPEMVSVGNRDFMMMGSQGGNVTPNNRLGGSVVINQSFDFRGADGSAVAQLRAEAGRIQAETISQVRRMQNSRGNSRV